MTKRKTFKNFLVISRNFEKSNKEKDILKQYLLLKYASFFFWIGLSNGGPQNTIITFSKIGHKGPHHILLSIEKALTFGNSRCNLRLPSNCYFYENSSCLLVIHCALYLLHWKVFLPLVLSTQAIVLLSFDFITLFWILPCFLVYGKFTHLISVSSPHALFL